MTRSIAASAPTTIWSACARIAGASCAWPAFPPTTLLTAYQVHSPDVLVVEEEWRDGPRPKVDALVTTRKNIAIAASSRRLRADPVRRSGGARRRRRPCRLARRRRRRAAGDGEADVRARRAAGAHPRRRRPLHRPGELRSRAGIPRAVPGAEPGQRALLPPGAARGPSHVRPRILRRGRARRDEARRDRSRAPRHLRARRTRSSATAAPCCARSRTTGGTSR